MQAFIEWTKAEIMKGLGVSFVTNLNSRSSSGYAHIMPVLGFKTSPAGAPGYSTQDTIFVHTDFQSKAVERSVGDYACTETRCVCVGCVLGHICDGRG